MRITRTNVENAKERARECVDALETFETTAEEWLDYQDQRDNGERPDPDDVRSARETLEAALETVEELSIDLSVEPC